MGAPCSALGMRGIGWIIPGEIGIQGAPDNFRHGQIFLLASLFQLVLLPPGEIEVGLFFAHLVLR